MNFIFNEQSLMGKIHIAKKNLFPLFYGCKDTTSCNIAQYLKLGFRLNT